ncbi:MAG: twin-arginine translocase TatA/TatE family subunit [Candidatus Cybelea sp.]
MLSVPDVLVVSVLALLLFGPDRLPKVMRQAGRFMRDVQNTSHSFIAEMERAADTTEPPPPAPPEPEPLSLDLKTGPDTNATPEKATEAS